MDPESSAAVEVAYQTPTIARLGTLAELTQGGTNGPADVMGGAGDAGSVPPGG